jgi:hypothetical protein
MEPRRVTASREIYSISAASLGRAGRNAATCRKHCFRIRNTIGARTGVPRPRLLDTTWDIVLRNGCSWIAVCDDLSVPGYDDGWLLLAEREAKGGLRGHKGNAGPSGVKIVEGPPRNILSKIPFMSDRSTGAPLRLRKLFEEYLYQATLQAPLNALADAAAVRLFAWPSSRLGQGTPRA